MLPQTNVKVRYYQYQYKYCIDIIQYRLRVFTCSGELVRTINYSVCCCCTMRSCAVGSRRTPGSTTHRSRLRVCHVHVHNPLRSMHPALSMHVVYSQHCNSLLYACAWSSTAFTYCCTPILPFSYFILRPVPTVVQRSSLYIEENTSH